jgi:uroporphyrinogen III methyltransferase/synthase
VEESAETVRELLDSKNVDMVTFTSSSTVKNFHRLIPPDKIDDLMKNVTVASIGPITSDTARQLGFSVDVEAKSYTIPGLVETILKNRTV